MQLKSFLKTREWGRLTAAPLFFVFCLSLLSCDRLGGTAKQATAPKTDSLSQGSAEPAGNMMTPGERFSFYRWLVKEMQEQILAKPVTDPSQVNSWANVLIQHGSLEGVYHGFVLSTEYSALEKGRADLKALRFFASEMAALDQPLLPETDPSIVSASEGYAKDYMGQPLFTLKRVLGERILEEAIKRKGDVEGLATWYASFAAKWSRMGVPLGAEQRLKTDEAFHFRWAKDNNLGLIQWELLNRAHRILNSLGGVALPSSPAAPATPAGK